MSAKKINIVIGAAALSLSAAFTPANDADAHPLYDRYGNRVPHTHQPPPPPVYGPPVYVDPYQQRRLQEEYNRNARHCRRLARDQEYYYDPPPIPRWCRKYL